jgi:cellulose synthase/poly-beta-1,6-N-acetylglucosamine synthase-like glycosyltransferase
MSAASIFIKSWFWIAASTIIYTYAGYPLFLFLRARFKPLATCQSPLQPFVSVVIAAYNEAAHIERKLKNLFSLSLSPTKFEVIVVSDGSTDSTNEILQSQNRSQLRKELIVEIPEGTLLDDVYVPLHYSARLAGNT